MLPHCPHLPQGCWKHKDSISEPRGIWQRHGQWSGSGQGSHQLWTSCTEGVLSTRSGSRLISFMMLARRTGSSCLRKVNDVFSQALLDPRGRERGEPTQLQTTGATDHLRVRWKKILHFLRVQRSDQGHKAKQLS